jgi:adenylate cyclase
VGSAGDSLLIEFASAVNAVECAVQMQQDLAARNGHLPENRRMAFRMGLNLGDVIAEGGTIHGDSVNIARDWRNWLSLAVFVSVAASTIR